MSDYTSFRAMRRFYIINECMVEGRHIRHLAKGDWVMLSALEAEPLLQAKKIRPLATLGPNNNKTHYDREEETNLGKRRTK
jgi:hypothetical protein